MLCAETQTLRTIFIFQKAEQIHTKLNPSSVGGGLAFVIATDESSGPPSVTPGPT